MSLWTPYADTPLDLTKPERSPEPPQTTFDYYRVEPMYYPAYGYVPSAQMSPLSGSSSCSGSVGHEVPPLPCRPPLSPPQSPVSTQQYFADMEALSDDPDFQAFERDALRAMAEKNGGSLLGNNPRMRRCVQSTQAADDSYRRQRARNNHAAKQSRDRRKLREIHLALKVAYLKNEVSKLKAQLGTTVCFRCRRLCEC